MFNKVDVAAGVEYVIGESRRGKQAYLNRNLDNANSLSVFGTELLPL
jgi:hypothetical protein